MGSNKRYPDLSGKLRIERLAKKLPLQTLQPEEVGLQRWPLTKDPNPKWVRAWVHFGDEAAHVDAQAVMWTPRAVAIEFTVEGNPMRAWVWSSAVGPKE